MDKFILTGGRRLNGEIKVKGAKNLALKALPAALLTDQEVVVSNVPQIGDVLSFVELLRNMGIGVDDSKNGIYRIRARDIRNTVLDSALCSRFKTAILMVGPMLARRGSVVLGQSGGCYIGKRPQNLFLAGFKAFGAQVKETKDAYHFSAKNGLSGAKFVFPWISVSATEALILAAVLAKGRTVLENAACEPEIAALAKFLNKCGAKIRGAGTSCVKIEGVRSLNGGTCRIIPDRIEAGSFVLLGLATGSPIKVSGINPEHLDVLWSVLEAAGAELEMGRDFVKLRPSRHLRAVEIRTHEYPGFPTDLQAPFTVLMTQAKGVSLIHETIFERRLLYTDMLNKMGARITMCDPHRVLVQGPVRLSGKHLISPDIRAGIALVIAALAARGQSVIENVHQIDRGYEAIEKRLQNIGADIRRVSE